MDGQVLVRGVEERRRPAAFFAIMHLTNPQLSVEKDDWKALDVAGLEAAASELKERNGILRLLKRQKVSPPADLLPAI